MNGFTDHSLNDDDFGESKSLSVRTFDAFPKTKASYTQRSHTGSAWTILLLVASVTLIIAETRHWFAGTVQHSFTVEKSISHQLQINLDVVVAMGCDDIHVNVQDASGDRILAGEMLTKDKTAWELWGSNKDHKLQDSLGDGYGLGDEEDVHDYLGMAKSGKRKFAKSPKLRGRQADACRIYGSIEGNKVQGDFHITARGHGYMEFGMHLEHEQFNFSHIINDLSFGPHYPLLTNPLSNTRATTPNHFYKFQYYTSIVPTIYTTDVHRLSLSPPSHIVDPSSGHYTSHVSGNTVWTNQYAVTEQSHQVGENFVPGIFVKFDIEPILLLVSEEWGGFMALLVRLVNVISGVLVAGSWCWALSDFVAETWVYKKGRDSLGFLNGRDEKLV